MIAKLNLPNRITLSRLVLAIVFFVLLSQYSQQQPQPWMLDVAVAIFIIAAVTDILDGYLARKFGQETPLGRVLDPFVDKVLVCGAFILFVGPGFVDAGGQNVTGVRGWMVVVIVSRELLVTGLRGFSESRGLAFGASVYGKLKMWVQSVAAPVILIIVAHEARWPEAEWPGTVKLVFVWATVIATALSTVHYLIRSRHILEESAPS